MMLRTASSRPESSVVRPARRSSSLSSAAASAAAAGSAVGEARGRDVAVEQLDAGQQQLAVELEDLVQLGGDVGADDVLDADAGRLELADGEQLGHVAALLLGDGRLLLLQHAQPLDGHFEVHLELGLRRSARQALG